MDRVNGADYVDIGGGRRGFRDEDLQNGIAGTEVTALWLNMTQEEILKVVTEAGLVPSEGDWTQLWQALQILGLASDARSRRWITVISMTLSSAPGAPSVGDTYLVPTGATGIWAVNVGKIAQWSGSVWTYLTPPDGHGISLPDGRVFERIGGTYVEKLALDAQSGKWNYAVAGGTANALTATISPTPAALTDGLIVALKTTAANTAAVTLNLNGLGAKPVLNQADGALVGGEFAANGDIVARYNTSLNAGNGAYVLLANAGGTAHGVTPPDAENSTKLATTGWVRNAMASIATALGFTGSYGRPGYIKLPSYLGGFMIQWGQTSSISSGGAQTVTFITSFPNYCLSVMTTFSATSNGNVPVTFGAGLYTTTQFQVYNYASSGSNACDWIAFGR